MALVRYVALIALVVWVGGMVVLGLVVAPTTVRVLAGSSPANGALLAGAVFAEALRLFHLVAFVCGAVIIVCLFAMKFVGPPPRSFPLRAGIVAAMLVVAGYSGTVLGGMADRAKTLMVLNLAGGLVLLAWYARE